MGKHWLIYQVNEIFQMKNFVDFLVEIIFKKNNIKVLELGCGTGSNIPVLLFYKMKITGIDFSNESIKICKKNLNQKCKI